MSAIEEASSIPSESLDSATNIRLRRRSGLTSNRRPAVAEQERGLIQTKGTLTVGHSRYRIALSVSAIICAVLVIGAAFPVILSMRPTQPTNLKQPIRYLGVYERSMPLSFAGVTAFTAATGVMPDVLMYYSSWQEPFQVSFATNAAKHGAIPLIQVNPFGVSLAGIASGQYDGYLAAYAEAVRAYARPVIIGFGHEMNGHWYPWGYTHTSPAVFVAAWRHIVTLFRELGAQNVTWLWTVNIIDPLGGIPSPHPWWPGNSYVTWVGIDGYYYEPSWTFASLFGPTIAAVREMTRDPIFIAETGAAAGADQAAKIADLFAGIRLYGLLGFVWFDAQAEEDWRLSSAAAIAEFHRGAEAYRRPSS